MSSPDRRRLRTRLVEQIEHIEVSAARYDSGRPIEANRLAVSVRVLVHDTASSRSLYGQMGIKDSLRWLTSDHRGFGPKVVFKISLVRFRQRATEHGLELTVWPIPQEDMLNPALLLDFATWWESPAMVAGGELIARKDIVDLLANQDGGAHVDLTKARYRRLMAAVPYMQLGNDDGTAAAVDSLDPEEISRLTLQAAMRTIAEELWLGYNNQLQIIDPDGDIPRTVNGRIRSGGGNGIAER